MKARMKNPAMVIADAMGPMQTLAAATKNGPLPEKLLQLGHLRASQINGCSFCVDLGAKHLKKLGETEERVYSVAAWREAPFYSDAERVALELAEVVTRQADRGEVVSDELWERATRHFDEKAMAQLILMIAVTNMFNRLNAPIRQPAGSFRVD